VPNGREGRSPQKTGILGVDIKKTAPLMGIYTGEKNKRFTCFFKVMPNQKNIQLDPGMGGTTKKQKRNKKIGRGKTAGESGKKVGVVNNQKKIF